MPSESESFLGIKEVPDPLKPVAKSILRKRTVWISTILACYGLSYTWLKSAMIFLLPYTILWAPLGLTSLFDPPANHARARVEMGWPEYLVHFVFWTLFLTGLIGCKSLPRELLRVIFALVAIILIFTMYGCSQYYYITPMN